MTLPTAENIDRFARAVETGWIGVIRAVEGELYRMNGVNWLNWQIAGGRVTDHIDEDDVQWFVPDDIRFLTNSELIRG